MKLLLKRIERAFNLTYDLVEYLKEANLQSKLPDLPSNTIGEQIWCVVGARESYLKAIKNNGWVGFSCSLNNVTAKEIVIEAVSKSSKAVLEFLRDEELSEKQLDLLLDLLEHEIQHHGQLIRYMYGNKLGFPQSWSIRYTV